MMKKILISPNGYKECAGPSEAARLIAEHLQDKGFELTIVPVSDGGDGFLDVCTKKFNLKEYKFTIDSPFGTRIQTAAGYDERTEILYIESAGSVGLKVVPPEKRLPMKLTSSGLGQLIRKAAKKLLIKKIVIGIGGTAVNDMALGALTELGLKLLDKNGKGVAPLPENYSLVEDFTWDPNIRTDFELIIDVTNPLTGEKGSSYVFGPQKGLKRKDILQIDREFGRLAELFLKTNPYLSFLNLSGAGGGLAAGFQIFTDSAVKTSAEFILQDIGLNDYLINTDAVITGEGYFDEQSFSGKASGIIIRDTDKPVFIICGDADSMLSIPPQVIVIPLQKYFRTKKESIQNFGMGISRAVDEIFKKLKHLK